MKIPTTGSVAVVALLFLALAGSGCESTPLLAPTGSSLTLLANPVSAAPDVNRDPDEEFYFTTVYAQLLDSGTSTGGGDGGTTTSGRSAPLVGVSITFAATGGNLRFNACVQGICSLDGATCPGGTLDCVQPTPEPLTADTNSAGVVTLPVAVSEDDPANITVTALSGGISQNVSFGNPLGAPNDEPEAQIGVSPPSPADASNGSVTVTFFSESTDPDGDEITCYEWTVSTNIGDATKVWGPDRDILSSSYSQEQALSVLLRVSDDPDAAASCNADSDFSPNVDTINRYVICNNTEPTASFSIVSVDTQPSTVTYAVNGGSSSDPESDIQTYQWDCDNGQEPTGEQTTCTFTRTSVTRFYDIELVVTDYSEEDECELESGAAVQSVEVPALGNP